MNPLKQIADNLAALNSDAPEVADAVIKLTNMAASRGVVDEVIRDLRETMEHCVSAAGEGVDYAVSRPMLDALTTLGLMEKVGSGRWAPTEAGEAFAALQAAALPAVPDGWVSVSERLPEEGVLVLVYVPDADGDRFDQDYIEDGAWAIHNEHREHYLAVGGPAAAGADVVCTGPSEDAPYTHWKPLRAPAAAPSHDQPEGSDNG